MTSLLSIRPSFYRSPFTKSGTQYLAGACSPVHSKVSKSARSGNEIAVATLKIHMPSLLDLCQLVSLAAPSRMRWRYYVSARHGKLRYARPAACPQKNAVRGAGHKLS